MHSLTKNIDIFFLLLLAMCVWERKRNTHTTAEMLLPSYLFHTFAIISVFSSFVFNILAGGVSTEGK